MPATLFGSHADKVLAGEAESLVNLDVEYLSSADFAMREEMALKAAILAEKFARLIMASAAYVDVILQLIDKAGDFVSDGIWFRVVQFVTNNENLQPYVAVKAREYLDKLAIHETMVSAYILGEYSHLLARRPGCSPKEILSIIHEKLPTVLTSTIPILLSTCAKILMHTQPSDPELRNQIWAIFRKKPPVSELGLLKVPSMSNVCGRSSGDSGQWDSYRGGSQPPEPSADLLGDLLSPLAIEGPPGTTAQSNYNLALEQKPIGDIAVRFNALCLKDSGVLYEDLHIQIGIKAEWRAHHGRLVLFLGNKNIASLASVQALILPPSHLKMELLLVPETIPPRAQVQCPLEVINLCPSRDVAVIDFSVKFGTLMVNVKLRLPAVLSNFFQAITVSAEEFFPQRRSLSRPRLKLQEGHKGSIKDSDSIVEAILKKLVCHLQSVCGFKA
ncbi:hypothetical protein Vadar_016227 [Vaccinium darrowii]|uniref:Uncharacterized protein n=1 Tax=Vaccinium darrowii TaxID=229202 RepID=A0ACB7XB67_9ERIC|nr:hypothetical protein Vadar_016227 [Vaccinium darrowii]